MKCLEEAEVMETQSLEMRQQFTRCGALSISSRGESMSDTCQHNMSQLFWALCSRALKFSWHLELDLLPFTNTYLQDTAALK